MTSSELLRNLTPAERRWLAKHTSDRDFHAAQASRCRAEIRRLTDLARKRAAKEAAKEGVN
jgi:hypothetical protein